MLTSHAIFSIEELDNYFTAGTHSAIIFDHDVFEGLHETTRDITCISRLYSRINQTFATSHSVEIEFRWGQARQIAVCDETLRICTVVILGEVR